MNLFPKEKETTDIEKNLWLPKGKEGQGKTDKLGGWN